MAQIFYKFMRIDLDKKKISEAPIPEDLTQLPKELQFISLLQSANILNATAHIYRQVYFVESIAAINSH